MRFLKVYIEITNVCNLKCSFCSKTTRQDRFMSIEEFEKIASQIKNYTSLITLHVKGEPLLHPNLKEILEVCEKSGLKVNITTNATLLDKKMDILLNSSSVRQLNLSLHSAEQNNIDEMEYINKVFNSVDKIHKHTNIIISYRLWNLKNLKSNSINTKILLELGSKYEIDNILERASKNDFIELDSNIFLNQDIEFEWPDMKREIISRTGKCYGLRNQIAILSNGDVVPCCLDANGDILLGNIFEESMSEILEKDKVKAIILGFERQELVEDLCKRCGFIKTRFDCK